MTKPLRADESRVAAIAAVMMVIGCGLFAIAGIVYRYSLLIASLLVLVGLLVFVTGLFLTIAVALVSTGRDAVEEKEREWMPRRQLTHE